MREKCQRCKGSATLECRLKNLGTLTWDWHIIACPDCLGTGQVVHDPNRVYAGVDLKNERPRGA